MRSSRTLSSIRGTASRRGAQQPCIPQASLFRRDNQQRESCVSYQERRQTHVSRPQRKNCVSEPCSSPVQSKDASRPQHCEASPFDPPPTDLRDYLTRKRSVNRITSSCCCERLITMLSECRCSPGTNQQSLARQLTLIPRSAKRNRSHRRRIFFDAEYPELTANMTSRSRGKQPAVSSDDESDTEPEGVY